MQNILNKKYFWWSSLKSLVYHIIIKKTRLETKFLVHFKKKKKYRIL
jgi:hypothetical protein